MLNLENVKNISNKTIGDLRDSILRQVSDKNDVIDVEYEKNLLVWHICQLQLIDKLLLTKKVISLNDWEQEITQLNDLSLFLKHKDIG